jgi:hypothetical protein
MSQFSADWLTLREPADMAARNQYLARRFAAMLPPKPRILDLGAGTGANARALAPLIAGAQEWFLVERDPSLCAAQAEAMPACATRSAFADEPWHFAPLALDVAAAWDALDAACADAVVSAAFFDLAGRDWIGRFAAWLGRRRLPLLATLMVDGRRRFVPADGDDALVAAAFRRHQGRDKGLGLAAGPDSANCLRQALVAHGYAVIRGSSDWELGPMHGDLLGAVVAGDAQAAREAAPGLIAQIDGWERRRRDALAAGGLTAVIGHVDLLAIPPASEGGDRTGPNRL